jgi:CheY-like chemotaxis protein
VPYRSNSATPSANWPRLPPVEIGNQLHRPKRRSALSGNSPIRLLTFLIQRSQRPCHTRLVEQPTASADPAAAAPAAGARVLLAFAALDRSCTETLRAHHVEFVEADNGIDALVKALAANFDVIVADAELPGIAGANLCQVLRQDPWTRDIPFILASNSRPTPSALLAVDLVVESPVEAGALLVSIHQVIELKGLKSVPTRALSFPVSQRHRRGQTMSPPLAPRGSSARGATGRCRIYTVSWEGSANAPRSNGITSTAVITVEHFSTASARDACVRQSVCRGAFNQE